MNLKRQLVLAMLVTLVCETAPAADWPNWLGPNRDGISQETGWGARIGDQVWTAEVGIGFSGIVVMDGRAYTMGHKQGKETVFCFDAKNGKVLWKQSYAAKLLPNLHEGGPSSTPTIVAGRAFTLAKDGQLNCWDAKTGAPIWRRNFQQDAETPGVPEWGFAASGVVLGEWIIYTAGATVAYHRDDGKIVWRSKKHRPGYGSVATFEQAGESLLATLNTDGLTILKAKDGMEIAHERWRTSFQTNANTPIIANGKILISTGYRRGCALFALEDGALRNVYENRVMSNHMNNSVLIDGYLYGFDGNTHGGGQKFLVCMEWATGKEKWRHEEFDCGTLRAAGKRLIILSESGELLLAPASPKAFKPTVRKPVLSGRCWTAPVLSNGRIYARNAQGHLVCVAVGNK